MARCVPSSHGLGVLPRGAQEETARVRKDDRLVTDAESIGRASLPHTHLDAIRIDERSLGCLGRRDGDCGQIECRGARETLLLRQAGHARGHHHDTGDEPGSEEYAPRDAKPAMRVRQQLAPVEYPQGQFINDTNTVGFSGYELLDAGVSYTRGRLQYALNLSNLTDRQYFTSSLGNRQLYSGQPFNVLATVRVRTH